LHAVDRQFDAGLTDCPGKSKCKTPKPSGMSCGDCPRGKDAPQVVETGVELEAARLVARLIAEKQSGYGVPLSQLSPIEFEMILLWEQRERAHRAAHSVEIVDSASWLKAFIKSFGSAGNR
jgi:hypothetical protein